MKTFRSAGASAALVGAALIGWVGSAAAYEETATVTFSWAYDGYSHGWTSNGVNQLSVMSNATHFWEQSGNNFSTYYNPDFATQSDYEPGTNDDCATTPPEYETIQLRKYACRISDDSFYYDSVARIIPVNDASGGGAATGSLVVTDTTLTGLLTVITTTDEPTGATTTFAAGLRSSNSAGNGFNGHNIRIADGSPFGNAWYGYTTSTQLAVNVTGVFTATGWTINGGTVGFYDPGFACQQGGFGGSNNGTLCTTSRTMGGLQSNGAHMSWGTDLDGANTGYTTPSEIPVRDSTGTSQIAYLSGVLATLSIDESGNITTDYGEYRHAVGRADFGCSDHLRFGGDTDPSGGVSTGISCGSLTAGPLDVSGTIDGAVSGTQSVVGSMGNAMNSCFNIAVALTSADCSYARTRTPIPANVPHGPKITSGFYALGSAGDQLGYTPGPGDGKLQLPLTGTVTIDDNDTPADGSDDLVSAQWTFGAGAHNAATGNGDRALERFTSWQHVMDATPVSSATPLQGGGFEYVIGSRGKPTPNPLCAAANAADCFPSENAPKTQDPPGFWSNAAWTLSPAARVGIERSPGFGLAAGPNVGARTTGTFTGYQCIDDPADTDCTVSEILLGSSSTYYRNESGPPSAHPAVGNCNDGFDNDLTGGTDAADPECVPVASSQPIPAPATPLLVSPPGFDNVILVMRTDATGTIIAADAYWTREYIIVNGPQIGTDPNGTYTTDNSWNGGRFTFAGVPGSSGRPRANSDSATVVGGASVTIDVLANDTGLASTPIGVSISSPPVQGTATVLADNRIQYTSTADAATVIAFYYEVQDALGRRSSARVEVTVTDPPGPHALDDQIMTIGTTPQSWPVLVNDQRLFDPPFTVEIVSGPNDGTVTVTGSPGSASQVVVTYTSANENTYSDDTFRYRVTDASGFSDVADVFVDRYPKMAQDDQLTVSSGDEEGGEVYPLQNDILPYEPPLYNRFNVGIVRNPAHGSVQVYNSPGYPYWIYIVYEPNPGFSGEDSFEYSVDNERRGSTATVHVTVVPDADNDGHLDANDNCVEAVNWDQRDTNGDGYGNACDADLDDNGMVNFVDLNLFRRQFGTKNPHADFNGSGLVNFADLTILTRGFGKPPGPSGTAP